MIKRILKFLGLIVQVRKRRVGHTAILRVSGILNSGPDVAQISSIFECLIAKKVKRVVVDLSDVKWFCSAGYNTLRACQCLINNAEGQMRLVGITQIESVWMFYELTSEFVVKDTVNQGLASFKYGSSRAQLLPPPRRQIPRRQRNIHTGVGFRPIRRYGVRRVKKVNELGMTFRRVNKV